MSRLCPSGTSACAVMPSTTVSSTRTTPSFGPGRRPRARLSPTGRVPATMPSGALRLHSASRSCQALRRRPSSSAPPRRCRAYVPPGSRAPARRGGPPRRPAGRHARSAFAARERRPGCARRSGRDARRDVSRAKRAKRATLPSSGLRPDKRRRAAHSPPAQGAQALAIGVQQVASRAARHQRARSPRRQANASQDRTSAHRHSPAIPRQPIGASPTHQRIERRPFRNGAHCGRF